MFIFGHKSMILLSKEDEFHVKSERKQRVVLPKT